MRVWRNGRVCASCATGHGFNPSSGQSVLAFSNHLIKKLKDSPKYSFKWETFLVPEDNPDIIPLTLGRTGCKQSSLNAPGMEKSKEYKKNLLSCPILELSELPFWLLAQWSNMNWLPSMKVRKGGNFSNKMGWMCFNWPCLSAPLADSTGSLSLSSSHSSSSGALLPPCAREPPPPPVAALSVFERSRGCPYNRAITIIQQTHGYQKREKLGFMNWLYLWIQCCLKSLARILKGF